MLGKFGVLRVGDRSSEFRSGALAGWCCFPRYFCTRREMRAHTHTHTAFSQTGVVAASLALFSPPRYMYVTSSFASVSPGARAAATTVAWPMRRSLLIPRCRRGDSKSSMRVHSFFREQQHTTAAAVTSKRPHSAERPTALDPRVPREHHESRAIYVQLTTTTQLFHLTVLVSNSYTFHVRESLRNRVWRGRL